VNQTIPIVDDEANFATRRENLWAQKNRMNADWIKESVSRFPSKLEETKRETHGYL